MSAGGDSQKHERFEADREDLLAEATALVDRVELSIESRADPVVVGFRRQGGASVYFGADPAYHFNSAGELRRAFLGGKLLKAERGRLILLERRRTGSAVDLVRQELTEGQQQELLDRVERDLVALREAIDAGRFSVRGHVTASRDADVLAQTSAWLGGLRLPVGVAWRPNVG